MCFNFLFFFRSQTEPFKTTLGYGLLLCRSPTPTHPVISTMQPPLTLWTEAITHHEATQVPCPQTALFHLRDQPVVKILVAPRTTGYWTATSPLKQGTVQLVSHTMYREVGIWRTWADAIEQRLSWWLPHIKLPQCQHWAKQGNGN